MKIITVNISVSVLERLDALVELGVYNCRSEAFRIAIRKLVEKVLKASNAKRAAIIKPPTNHQIRPISQSEVLMTSSLALLPIGTKIQLNPPNGESLNYDEIMGFFNINPQTNILMPDGQNQFKLLGVKQKNN